MNLYRRALPQLGSDLFLTDGGIDERHIEAIAKTCRPLFEGAA